MHAYIVLSGSFFCLVAFNCAYMGVTGFRAKPLSNWVYLADAVISALVAAWAAYLLCV